MTDDDGSSIGSMTDFREIARHQREAISKLHATIKALRTEILVLQRQAMEAQRRGAERMQERCVYVCASVGAFAALDKIKRLDVDALE